MVPCSTALDCPHALAEWVTMLIVTHEVTGAAASRRTGLVMLVYLHRHDTLARIAACFGISVGTAHA